MSYTALPSVPEFPRLPNMLTQSRDKDMWETELALTFQTAEAEKTERKKDGINHLWDVMETKG